MASDPHGSEQSFLQELRQYLGGAGRWMRIALIVLGVLVLLIVLFGSLDALPFVYDSF